MDHMLGTVIIAFALLSITALSMQVVALMRNHK